MLLEWAISPGDKMVNLPHAKRGMDTADPESADPKVGHEERLKHFTFG